MLNGNGNCNDKRIFTIGNLIPIVLAAGMVGGVYAAVQGQMSDNKRSVDDLWHMVYELKKDTKDWEGAESAYDREIREETRRQTERINELSMRLGAPPRTNGP